MRVRPADSRPIAGGGHRVYAEVPPPHRSSTPTEPEQAWSTLNRS